MRGFYSGAFSFKRLCILVLLPILCWQAVSTTAANVLREKSPDGALKLSPFDPGALAKRNDFNLRKDDLSGHWRVSEFDARTSLKSEALNVEAVRQLAFVAENNGDLKRAKALMISAERMSRRDVGAQLWLANQQAVNNDVKSALRHIDTSLRAVPESRTLLFPLLMESIDDPSFQAEFAPYIASSPTWLASFIDHALTVGKNLNVLSQSIAAAGGLPSNRTNSNLNARMLNHLSAAGNYVEMLSYYNSMKRADVSILTGVTLKQSSIDPNNGPLAWSTKQDVEIDASIVTAAGDKGYQIDIYIGSGKRRAAAHKLLYLKPGRYRFAAHHLFNAGGNDSAINWDWQCVADANPRLLSVMTFRASDAKTTSGRMAANLNVSSECPVQLLKITAIGGSAAEDSSMTIKQLQLTKF